MALGQRGADLGGVGEAGAGVGGDLRRAMRRGVLDPRDVRLDADRLVDAGVDQPDGDGAARTRPRCPRRPPWEPAWRPSRPAWPGESGRESRWCSAPGHRPWPPRRRPGPWSSWPCRPLARGRRGWATSSPGRHRTWPGESGRRVRARELRRRHPSSGAGQRTTGRRSRGRARERSGRDARPGPSVPLSAGTAQRLSPVRTKSAGLYGGPRPADR